MDIFGGNGIVEEYGMMRRKSVAVSSNHFAHLCCNSTDVSNLYVVRGLY